ncbi:MAG: homoserine kinase [Chloroflexi bacterium]|nr:homoserine kinase [Chloroflexota bacterium]
MSSIVVRAPASSANLGAGFDCLGVALDLWNEVAATPGRLAGDDDSNLILRAARATYALVGARYPGFELRCVNRIVFNSGLGSSAAAIACGVLVANHCLGNPLDESALLNLAVEIEGHPDNVVPCLLGGARVAIRLEDGRVVQSPVSVALELTGVCFLPDQGVPTAHARGLLPASVTRTDAIFNVARASLMVAALSAGRADLLAEATRDRLHQPYRLPLFPAGATLLEVAMHAGALGAFVSGAGPTVMALCASDACVSSVAQAFGATAQSEGVPGKILRLGLSTRGAHVVG